MDDLGDFDCRCHPEIMTVLVYSLNDSDERVRAQAADEIGALAAKLPGTVDENPQIE